MTLLFNFPTEAYLLLAGIIVSGFAWMCGFILCDWFRRKVLRVSYYDNMPMTYERLTAWTFMVITQAIFIYILWMGK